MIEITGEKKDFALERYKYVLDQKRNLNERTFKIASVYQAYLAILVAGQYKVLYDYRELKISVSLAELATWSLFVLNALASILYLSLLLGGIASWMKYRRDESVIEEKVFGQARPAPTWSNWLGWYETYLIAGGLIVLVLHVAAIATCLPILLSR